MSKRALVVDDSLTIRRLVGQLLKNNGFEVVEAQNGKDAADKVKVDATFTLVITDLNMPVMDGIEFIRELRAVPQYKFVPVIFLTTETDTVKREDARAIGATAWIVKPFAPEKVLAVVQRIAA